MNQTRALPLVAALLAVGLCLPAVSPAQETAASPSQQTDGGFLQAASTAQQDLERSLQELAALRETIVGEKLPLNQKLTALESRMFEVRAESDEVNRLLDTRNLDLNNLRAEIKARHEETIYLSTLLDEYIRNFESRVHISELQRYRELLEKARLAPEDEGLTSAQVYAAQTELVEASLDRLVELVGGMTFPGSAVDDDGLVKEVRFALIGPVALYSTEDGTSAGLAEQRLGSLEPNMIALEEPGQAEEVHRIVASGGGHMPFDPTLGNARKIEATQDTFQEHILKGGPVMVPILILALAALLVGIAKWVHLARVRKPSTRRINALLEALKSRNYEAAAEQANATPGPTGEMLRVGLEHLGEPKELVEEVMYEKTLETRLSFQSFLPFVALSAAAAPLLGLLGTVTGIINTFKLITVFGTGDAKTLSSGISEALITTEFGLIVAIPSLLIHGYLTRKARRLIDGMEKTAVSFLNRIPATPAGAPAAETAPATAEPTSLGGNGAPDGQPVNRVVAAVVPRVGTSDEPAY
jgi:biopolymer transport protein ExbB